MGSDVSSYDPDGERFAMNGAGGHDADHGASARPRDEGTVERASLDKVREIVVGPHARDVDRRLARLEQRLEQELAGLAERLERRLDTLDRFVRAETASLAEAIATEQRARVADREQLAGEVRRVERQGQEQTQELADRTSRVARELRELLLAEAQGLREQLSLAERSLGRTIDDRSRELDHAKTDRAQLASMLSELAHRLAGDPSGSSR